MENVLKTFKVIVKVCETKATLGNPARKFNTYKAVQKDGKLVDCKFRKEVIPLPTENSIVEVFSNNMNMAKNTLFPCLWVAKIEKITPTKDIHVEISNEDLPF